MKFDREDIVGFIDLLIVIPLTLFSIYYFGNVLYYHNIGQYTHRYLEEIEHAITNQEITWFRAEQEPYTPSFWE